LQLGGRSPPSSAKEAADAVERDEAVDAKHM
jgi:hypothetical protein